MSVGMTRICSLWILLAAITLSQLWRGITGQVPSYSIEVASSIRVQEGHNASIPCKFIADGRNTFRNSFGYWIYLYSKSIIATNDKSSAVQQRNFYLTGNPDSGDCTLTITDARREDDGEYYFRFEESKNSKVKYSYEDIKTHIIVTGIKERIVFSKGYSIEVNSSVSVQEDLSVTIPCKFSANSRNTFRNSFGYWRDLYSESVLATNDKSSAVQKPNFNLTGNPDSGDCTLTITDTRREDEGIYYFRFEEGKNSKVKYNYYREVTTTITVTGLTCQVVHSPGYSITVASSVGVQEGLCVTIPCNFTADGRNTFNKSFGYWMRMPQHPKYIVATNDKSSAVQKPNFNLTGNPDSGDCTLTITDARREDQGVYYFRFLEGEKSKVKYCYHGEMATSVTVTGLTEEPVVSGVGTLIAGVKKTLTCDPPRNCPAISLAFQWKKSNVTGIWKNSSTITFTPSIDDDQETITCEMTNSKGNTTQKHIPLDFNCFTEEPVISDFGTLIAGVNKTLTCAPPSNCPMKSLALQWMKSNVAGIWKNSSTITFTPSIDDNQETITCEITNSRGKTTQKHIPLDVDLPLLKDPKVIAGLITGIAIVVSAILFGIIFLVWRKKKTEPKMYENMPRIRESNRTCVAKRAAEGTDNIYMNSIN